MNEDILTFSAFQTKIEVNVTFKQFVQVQLSDHFTTPKKKTFLTVKEQGVKLLKTKVNSYPPPAFKPQDWKCCRSYRDSQVWNNILFF